MIALDSLLVIRGPRSGKIDVQTTRQQFAKNARERVGAVDLEREKVAWLFELGLEKSPGNFQELSFRSNA